MRLFRVLFTCSFLSVTLATAWVIYFSVTPLGFEAETRSFDLKAGSRIKIVANELVNLNVLDEPYSFHVMMRITGLASDIKAGNYIIKPEMTPFEMGMLFSEGAVDTQYSITFIEGYTFSEMRALLKEKEHLKHLTIAMTDKQILERIGASEQHPEGLFFPDTYFFSEGMSDIDVLKRAYDSMQRRLGEAWMKRSPSVPYQSAYQALIMASLVEKETGKSSERPEIAGVFLNRLKVGMRLQTDPTVIYGMGEEYDGNIRKKDLLTDTPYNTYTRDGLPPTPIAMPGMASIEAALHPAETKALYFVGRGDGSHAFSTNLNDHNKAVYRYQLKHR